MAMRTTTSSYHVSISLFPQLRRSSATTSWELSGQIRNHQRAHSDKRWATSRHGVADAEAGVAGRGDALVLAVAGQEEAAPVVAGVSQAMIVHGAATAVVATANLAKDAQQTSSGGPKAKDAPGVSAGGQATDQSAETNWDRAAIPRSTEPAATLVRGQITGHATKVPNSWKTPKPKARETSHSILLIKTARRSLRVLTMSIPTKLPMTDRSRTKRLWIGKVEVRAAKPTDVLADAKGAFVNLVTWASNIDEFKKNAELVLVKLGLSVIDIENPEPFSIRRQKADFDDEIEDMVSRAENNPNAIIYGTFHTWTRDDA